MALALSAGSLVFPVTDKLPTHMSYDFTNAVCYTDLNSDLIARGVCVVPIINWRDVEPLKRAKPKNTKH
jgi:hypothetical protein